MLRVHGAKITSSSPEMELPQYSAHFPGILSAWYHTISVAELFKLTLCRHGLHLMRWGAGRAGGEGPGVQTGGFREAAHVCCRELNEAQPFCQPCTSLKLSEQRD